MNYDETNLWEAVEQYAKMIGIDLIGVTDVAPFYTYKERYIDRKTKGYLSGFEGDCIEDKIYPVKVMPEAKSIIAVAMSYNQNFNDLISNNEEVDYNNSSRYQVSRFARGIDYHIVLKNKLEQIVSFIKNKLPNINIQAEIFVDTGALPDREIAYRAGLGFFGKNNMIINPDYGSFLFLGHVLINIEIKNDKEKYECMCNECNMCVKVCPTNALEREYCFNAKRCISYNTQVKGEIDEDIARHISKTIYGCDICQDICYYNKNAIVVNHKEFIDDLRGIPHDDLFKLSNRKFIQLYKNRTFSWRGREVLKRNAEYINNVMTVRKFK